MATHTLTVVFEGDEDEFDYLVEAIDQAGGFVASSYEENDSDS